MKFREKSGEKYLGKKSWEINVGKNQGEKSGKKLGEINEEKSGEINVEK